MRAGPKVPGRRSRSSFLEAFDPGVISVSRWRPDSGCCAGAARVTGLWGPATGDFAANPDLDVLAHGIERGVSELLTAAGHHIWPA
jgi:hypothetical protein